MIPKDLFLVAHLFEPLPPKPWSREQRRQIRETFEVFIAEDLYLGKAREWYFEHRWRNRQGRPTAMELTRLEAMCKERWRVARRMFHRWARYVIVTGITLLVLSLVLKAAPLVIRFLRVHSSMERPLTAEPWTAERVRTAPPVPANPADIGRLAVTCSVFGHGEVRVTVLPGDPFTIVTDPPETASPLSACVAKTLRSDLPASWADRKLDFAYVY